MDHLKVYTKDPAQTERTCKIIQHFSDDIILEFNLDKCAVIHIEKGKIIPSEIVNEIPLLSSVDSYKYL